MADALTVLRHKADNAGWLDSAASCQLQDVHGLYQQRAGLLLYPDSTEVVSEIMAFCYQHELAVVPQSGNTGYVGGAMPTSDKQVVLSLQKMNKLLDVHAANNTMLVDAGCRLAQVQSQAAAHNRLFPLGLSVADSCLIGGNLASNAGGTSVLRYGNARDLVLGLEVVLANGRILEQLQTVRKDNSGYDLKQLFLGSEGTLGIITKAVLKLFPRPQSQVTALLGFTQLQQIVDLRDDLSEQCGESLVACEYWQQRCVQQALRYNANLQQPLVDIYPHYLLVELNSTLKCDLTSLLQQIAPQLNCEHIAITEHVSTIKNWWQLRATFPKAQRQLWTHLGSGLKHDIALSVEQIPEFLVTMKSRLLEQFEHLDIAVFGHLGDGNLHYNIGTMQSLSASEKQQINHLVYDQVMSMGGSFSAEHGIGQAKRSLLTRYKSPIAVALMRTLKQCLDPKQLLNPGKVL